MIYIRELTKEIPSDGDHYINLTHLHYKLNVIRAAYQKPMIVTSGYRTKEEHFSIYKKKGVDVWNIPTKSQHLIGAAADISDPQGDIKNWVTNNITLMEKLDLYMESFDITTSWLHLQLFQPNSGKRFFYP